MKVYTEIIYTWNDDKGELVEESSKSFEYEGEVILCHKKMFPHPHGGIGGQLYDAGTDIAEGVLDLGGDIIDAAGDLAGDFGEIPGAMADWTGWSDYTKDMATGAGYLDPANVPDWLKDMWEQGSEAFYEGLDKTEENLADIAGDIETGIAENTDSLNDLESGINTTVADAVDIGETGIENLAIVGDALQDTATLAGEGVSFVTGATIDINNPNALVVSPQNWYEEWGIVSDWDLTGGNDDPLGLMDTNMDILSAVLWDTYGGLGGGGGSGGSAATGSGSNLGPGFSSFEGLQGDPFGREGKERREIHQLRKFPQQVASAPSLVNQRRNLS